MCVICVKEAGVEPLDMAYFDRAWERNPDGAGIVFYKPDNDCAYVRKGIMNKKDFLDFVQKINKKENSYIVHCRIKSRGAVCAANTHPFIYESITFAHNGTLAITTKGSETDTEAFGNRFFADRDLDWVKDNQDLLEYTIGTSKFAIMDNSTGEIFILNKSLGKEEAGVWFSNSSALPTTQVSSVWSSMPTQAADEYFGSDKWKPSDRNAIYSTADGYWKTVYGGPLYVPLSRGHVAYNRRGFPVLIKLPEFPELKTSKDAWSDEETNGIIDYLKTEIEDEFECNDTIPLDKDSVIAAYMVYDTITRYQAAGYEISLELLDKALFDKGFSYAQTNDIDRALDAYRETILQSFLDAEADFEEVNNRAETAA